VERLGQPLGARATVISDRHSPDTVAPVGDVQLTIIAAGYNVPGISHSFDVNTCTEWTECVGRERLDDGGLSEDDIHDVT